MLKQILARAVSRWILGCGCAIFPLIVRGDVTLINDLKATIADNSELGGAAQYAEVFKAATGGDITKVILSLNYSGTVPGTLEVYLFKGASSSSIGAEAADLGPIKLTADKDGQQLAINPLATYDLTAGADYAIVINGTSQIGWDFESSGAGTGNLVGGFDNGTSEVAQGIKYSSLMDIEVPEPSGTGVTMAGGALFAAALTWWRHRPPPRSEHQRPSKHPPIYSSGPPRPPTLGLAHSNRRLI